VATLSGVSVSHSFLGLLERGPQHGYGMKAVYDSWFGSAKPLKSGQIYSTLGRLERDGLVAVGDAESGLGPDRKMYVITGGGVEELESWISTPQPPEATTLGPIYAKVVVALITGRSATSILASQRAVHLARMRELRSSLDGSFESQLAVDYLVAHLQADLEWIDQAGERATRWTENQDV